MRWAWLNAFEVTMPKNTEHWIWQEGSAGKKHFLCKCYKLNSVSRAHRKLEGDWQHTHNNNDKDDDDEDDDDKWNRFFNAKGWKQAMVSL